MHSSIKHRPAPFTAFRDIRLLRSSTNNYCSINIGIDVVSSLIYSDPRRNLIPAVSCGNYIKGRSSTTW